MEITLATIMYEYKVSCDRKLITVIHNTPEGNTAFVGYIEKRNGHVLFSQRNRSRIYTIDIEGVREILEVMEVEGTKLKDSVKD